MDKWKKKNVWIEKRDNHCDNLPQPSYRKHNNILIQTLMETVNETFYISDNNVKQQKPK